MGAPVGVASPTSRGWMDFGYEWLGDLDSNQDCPSQSREFYR